jgi:predicted RNA-binding protein Jag
VTEPEAVVTAATDRTALAASVLTELLRLADVPATLDVRDVADGGISIALVLGVEVPGVTAGRRGTFVDALQFLVNKLTHRPGSERRWVSLGIGDHPPPRGARQPRPTLDVNGAARVVAPPGRGPAAPRPPSAALPAAARAQPPDESTLEVSEDAELTGAARALAEASARTGRLYGVVALSAEDRARVLRAVADVSGVRASSEGEGRLRRLVLTPSNPVPMPRRLHPLEIDDDADGGSEGTGG